MVAYKMDQEKHFAVIIGSDLATARNLQPILDEAGWRGRGEEEGPAHALILSPQADAMDSATLSGCLRTGLGPAPDGSDFVIDLRASRAELVARLAAWLPPSLMPLIRMEAAFGRAALEPLLEGLARELARAVGDVDAGRRPDAHKLAGLSGTFGFPEVGESWRAVDQGKDDLTNARRLSRTTLFAIAHWLEGQEMVASSV